MRHVLRLTIAAFLLVHTLQAAPAAAQNVDFNDTPLGSVPPATALSFPNPLFVYGISGLEVTEGAVCGPGCADNGTRYIRTFFSGITGSVIVQGHPVGGTCCVPFDLVSIDVAEPDGVTTPMQYTFAPIGTGGSPVVFITDGINDGSGPAEDFETVVLTADFLGVDSVNILSDSPGLGVQLDNLNDGSSTIPVLPALAAGALALLIAATGVRAARR